MNSKQKIIKSHLSHFFKALDTATMDSLEGKPFEELQKSYLALKNLCKKHTAEDLANLSNRNQRLIKFLNLGIEANEMEQSEFQDLAHVLVMRGDVPIEVSLMEYLKTEEGHKICYGNSRHSYNEKEIYNLFNNVFGIKVSEELKNSVRAEDIGSMIAYALSGRADHLKEDYESYMGDKDNYPRYDNIASFLMAMSKKYDVEMRIDEKTNANELYADINQSKNKENLNGTREKSRADHCIVNGNRVAFGSTTTSRTMERQGTQYLNYLCAMMNLRKMDHPKNNHQNCEVVPFYFSTGIFCSSKPARELMEQNGSGVEFLKSLKDCSTEERKSLGQLNFLSLLGNTSDPSHVAALFCHNPIIAGTDTLDLYNLSEEVKKCMFEQYPVLSGDDAREQKLKEVNHMVFDKVYKRLCSAIDGLLKSSSSFDNNKIIMEDMFFNITAMITKMDKSFYLDRNNDAEKMVLLSDKIKELCEQQRNVLKKNGGNIPQGYLDKIDSLEDAVEKFDVDQIKITLTKAHKKRIKNRDTGNDISSVFEKFNGPNKIAKDNYESKESLKEQAKGRLNEFDLSTIAHTFNVACNDSANRLNERTREQFIRCVSVIGERLEMGRSLNGITEEIFSTKRNKGSVSSSITNLIKDLRGCGYELTAEFVEKSRFLLSSTFSNKPDTSAPNKMKKLIDFFVKYDLTGEFYAYDKGLEIRSKEEKKQKTKKRYKMK